MSFFLSSLLTITIFPLILIILAVSSASVALVPAPAISISSHACISETFSQPQPLSPTTTTVLRHHPPKQLVFADEFFDFNKEIWSHEISPPGHKNGEFQSYTESEENSYVKDGILYIKPTVQVAQGVRRRNKSISTSGPSSNSLQESRASLTFAPIRSARLHTRSSFAFQYGSLEVRAKLPEGDWLWPAVWLLPQQNRYGGWPCSGEIDLIESRGNLELVDGAGEDIGIKRTAATIHFGMNRSTDSWRLANFPTHHPQGFHSHFHNYGMRWSPDEIAFTLDGESVGKLSPPEGGFWEVGNFSGESIWSSEKISPFDQPFNLVLNVAVGGTFGYFPDNTGPKSKPWNNSSPTAIYDFWGEREQWEPTWKGEDSALQIDYIRIWAL